MTEKTVMDAKPAKKSLLKKVKAVNTLLPPAGLIPRVIYKHYTKGPAAKSWTLSEDLNVSVLREVLSRGNKVTVEDIQSLTNIESQVPDNVTAHPFSVPNSYRIQAGKVLLQVFTPVENYQIGWDWEFDRNQPELGGEWLKEKKPQQDNNKTLLYLHGGGYYTACCEFYRPLLGEFIESTKARTCAINFRSAPQDPFPAGLQDALATYLYLLDPPANDSFTAIEPKDIVIGGDSAGGGLAVCLLIAIRDANLPMPAGGISISGLFDLTNSFPSFKENIMTDSLPYLWFRHMPSPALNYDALPKLKVEPPEGYELDTFGDDYERHQFYAPNKALRISMISPVFDKKNLRGLPRILMQCGQVERLRDENIYAALLASSHYKESTEKATPIQFETYIDQPHCCQVVFKNKAAIYGKKSIARFFNEVTQGQEQKETLEAYSVQPDGSVKDIKESFLKEHTPDKLDDWTNMLNNPSFKDRAEKLEAAYRLALKK